MKTIFISLLKLYRVSLGPLLRAFGAQCRFEPTCSTYCEQAINEHGVSKGLILTIKRLGRCQPYSDGGYDPVPPSNLTKDDH